ncbi:UNVERIFIED_CONTAM: APO protein 2, chloroplastic [Sesamum calycinum]|uniref:APO protein 2, chloroplastic n=1 Tax=Sesamum calycinum TaxID=2727403 RepID=A0AAW2JBK3_9LAMI
MITCQRNFGISSQQHLTRVQALVIECNHPRYYSKKEKKPFPIPIVELRRAARERLKNRKNQPRGIPPPKRGLVILRLIPVAYKVLNARITLINNPKKLLKVMPANACK